ncbi:Uu.00g086930.m01.CDS01 [Anthostomella pinea]|uniref:Uu.00g086930.m01.CDS01 n=1 Tax=Anthostomella pinea TaxID=933095 RepID=A0AAI8VMV2_9PEZI|nr:Uu.00g086930.m01.CDS01 [Anthostomella pinea]
MPEFIYCLRAVLGDELMQQSLLPGQSLGTVNRPRTGFGSNEESDNNRTEDHNNHNPRAGDIESERHVASRANETDGTGGFNPLGKPGFDDVANTLRALGEIESANHAPHEVELKFRSKNEEGIREVFALSSRTDGRMILKALLGWEFDAEELLQRRIRGGADQQAMLNEVKRRVFSSSTTNNHKPTSSDNAVSDLAMKTDMEAR